MSRGVQDMVFEPDGTVRFIYSDDLAEVASELGPAETRRASHVEPSGGWRWRVDLAPVGGPKLDGFNSRASALEFEVAWLKKHRGL